MNQFRNSENDSFKSSVPHRSQHIIFKELEYFFFVVSCTVRDGEINIYISTGLIRRTIVESRTLETMMNIRY